MNAPVLSAIPTFAVVGRVNMGKSAVIATLLEIDDNEVIRVSPTPGETTRCQPHPVVFGHKECLRFIDTPGFSQPIEAMRAIRQLHGEGTPGLETLRRFTQEAGEEFGDEKRLLQPLLDGAGVLYIVDPAKPLRDDFLAEMEILRWTGRPRLALLNRHAETTAAQEEMWREKLGGAFNLVRTFDAHHARYEERLRLLKSLLEIEERHRPQLEETIRLVESEWDQRRDEAAERILTFLEEALCLRVSATLEEKDLLIPSRKQKKGELLTRRYLDALKKLEKRCFEELLKIYRHHLLKADVAEQAFTGIDLESDETWTKWGLERGQLAIAAAVTGGAAGFAVDAMTGFLSHGVGTLIGSLGMGAAAWLKGGSLPDLRLSLLDGMKISAGEGRTLTMGPLKSANFPWILFDGVLARYQQILARAHGRRDEQVLSNSETSYTRGMAREQRDVLAKWFGSCLKGSPNRALEPEVFRVIGEVLEKASVG
ncbi:MAG: GTPase/DUF3482 domain-containing protein [Luteolibacter sp.]